MQMHGEESALPSNQPLQISVMHTAKRICVENVHTDGLMAFISSCLITLDKNPGVRSIGIGEIPCRIIGKAILTAISDDIQAAAGPQQLCAGQEAGEEAAVQAIRQFFQSPDADAVYTSCGCHKCLQFSKQVDSTTKHSTPLPHFSKSTPKHLHNCHSITH